MKREILRNAADIPVMAEPVPGREVAWAIYEALEKFYARHEQKDVPEQDSLKFAVSEATIGDDPPWIRRDMKATPEEERGLVQRMLTPPSYIERVYEVDEIIRILHRNRKLDANIQILIDLVEAVLKEAGSRVDWDACLSPWQEAQLSHCDDDPADWPDA